RAAVGSPHRRAACALAAALLLVGLAAGCSREDRETPATEAPRAGAPGGGLEEAPEAAPAPAAPAAPPAAPETGAGEAGGPPAAGGAPAGGDVPQPTDPPDAAQGQQLYAQYCASCHGPEGAGDGPIAATLDPKPASHADGEYMNSLSNAHVFQVIKGGGPAVGKSPLMAPWGGTLSDDQIWDLVAFVRSLADPPYPGSVP